MSVTPGPQESHGAAPPRIGKYELGDLLGEGAMGVVYRARDTALGRDVAVKVMRESFARQPLMRERFLREARIMAGLSHPNLIVVHDSGEHSGGLYLVMELVEGRSLDSLIDRHPKSPDAFLKIVEEAARGVAAAHDKGVVHRDLKPENILVTGQGSGKVGDFGLAHIMSGELRLSRTGVSLGTPLYMSPEQVRGDHKATGPATDVYSLGAILYEGVTGRLPHPSLNNSELYHKILTEIPARPRRYNKRVSPDVEAIILKALEKDPMHRYPTARELAEDLARCREGKPVQARRLSSMEMIVRRLRGNRLFKTATAGIAVAAAVILAFLLGRRRVDPSPPTSSPPGVREKEAPVVPPAAAPVQPAPETSAAWPHFQRGLALAEKGDLPGALAAYSEAVAVDPSYSEAYNNRGGVHTRMGDVRSAREDFDAAILANPANAPAYANRGALREQGGDAVGAMADYDQAIALDARTPEYHKRRGTLNQHRGRIRAAIDDFTRAIELDPDHFESLNNRGNIRWQIGEVEGAIADLEAAIRINARIWNPHYNLGNALLRKGDAAAAVRSLERAAALAPQEAMIRQVLEEARRRVERE